MRSSAASSSFFTLRISAVITDVLSSFPFWSEAPASDALDCFLLRLWSLPAIAYSPAIEP
jgi:hypothetical protein